MGGKFFSSTLSKGINVALYVAAAVAAAASAPYSTAIYIAAVAYSLIGGVQEGLYQKAQMRRAMKKMKEGNGHLLNTQSSQEEIPIVYGTCRVGGNFIFQRSDGDNNKYLYQVMGISEGAIQKIYDVWLDEKPYIFSTFGNQEITRKSDTEISFTYPTASNIEYLKIFITFGVLNTINVDNLFWGTEATIQKGTVTTINLTRTDMPASVSGSCSADYNVNGTVTITASLPAEYTSYLGNVTVFQVSVDGVNWYSSEGSIDNYVWWAGNLGEGTITGDLHSSDLYTDLTNPTSATDGQGFTVPDNTAFLAVRLQYDGENFNTLPQITCTVAGRTLYDPRTETIAFSNNAALVLRDYMTNTRYGMGVPEERLDADSWNNVISYCASGGYTFDGVITDGRSLDIVEMILGHFRGVLVPTPVWDSVNSVYTTRYKLKIKDLNSDLDPLPTLHITEEDILQDSFTLVKGDITRRPNIIDIKYINPSKDYKIDTERISLFDTYGNLISPANTFTSGTWVKSNFAVSANQIGTPAGDSTGSLLTSSGAAPYLEIDVTSATASASGSDYYVSLWVRAETNNSPTMPIIRAVNDGVVETVVSKATLRVLDTNWFKVTKKIVFTGTTTRKVRFIFGNYNYYVYKATLSLSSAVGLDEDKRISNVDLIGTNPFIAKKLGAYFLDRARLDTSISFTLSTASSGNINSGDDYAVAFEVSDLFYFSYDSFSITQQLFRIDEINRTEEGLISIKAVLEDTSLYDQTLNLPSYDLDLTNLPSFNDKPTAPSFTLSTGVETNSASFNSSYISVAITQVSPFVKYHEAMISTDSGFATYTTARLGGGSVTEKILGLKANTLYYIKLKAVSIYDISSDYTSSQSVTTAIDTAAPADVAAFTATIDNNKMVKLTWSPNSEADLKGYEIRTGANWAAGTEIAALDSKGIIFEYQPPLSGAYTFWIKAVDISSNYSNAVSATYTVQGQVNAPYRDIVFGEGDDEVYETDGNDGGVFGGTVHEANTTMELMGSEFTLKLNNDGHVAGMGVFIDQTGSSEFTIVADKFQVVNEDNSGDIIVPFIVDTTNNQISINGELIVTGSITADKLTVTQLSAITANMGNLTSGTITLDSSGHFKSGQTAYNTGSGFWLGKDGSTTKLSLGNSAGNSLTWDGSALSVVGGITATTGNIGGWTIATAELSAGGIKLQSTAERILVGSATAPLAGTGIFIGKDSSDYELRVGNPAGKYIHWDGSDLILSGEVVNTSNIVNLAITNAKVNDVNFNKLTTGTITSQTITLSAGASDVFIAAGKTDFDQDSTAGFIIGRDFSDSSLTKLEIGSNTNLLKWNGSTLSIRGSLNADDLVAGTITGRTLQTSGSGQRFVVSADDNEAHFYGNRGDGTVEEIASIGISNVFSGDTVIGDFGTYNTSVIGIWAKSNTKNAIVAESAGANYPSIFARTTATSNGTAIFGTTTQPTATCVKGSNTSLSVSGYVSTAKAIDGYSNEGIGVYGQAAYGYGGVFENLSSAFFQGRGNLRLTPDPAKTGIPTHVGNTGAIYVTNDLLMSFNTDGVSAWTPFASPKCCVTPDGGFATLMTADEAMTEGNVVAIPQSGSTGQRIKLCPISGNENDMPIGVFWRSSIGGTSAVSGDSVWIVTSGQVKVLPEAGITPAKGNFINASTSTAGRVTQAATVPVAATHFKEIGHYLETGSLGTAAMAIVHFN